MGEKCSTHGGDENCVQNLKGRDHSEELGASGEITLECILGK
jgi:hypothetical protein